MNKKLITELKRMAELMGNKTLLMEGENPFAVLFSKGAESLGIRLEKSAETTASKLGKAFEKRIISSGDRALEAEINRIASKGLENVTEKELQTLYSIPGFRKAMVDVIASVAPRQLEAAAESMVQRGGEKYSNALRKIYFDKGPKGGIEGVKNYLRKKGLYDEELDLVWSNWKPKGPEVPIGGKTSELKPGEEPLIPGKKKPKIEPEKLSSQDADEIIAGIRANPKYPYFRQFEATVDSLPVSDKVKRIIKINYEQYYDLSVDELLTLGNNLNQKLNEAEWGWLKKTWNTVSKQGFKGQMKIAGSVSGLIIGVSLIYAAVNGAWVAKDATDKAKKKVDDVLNPTGTPTPTPTPTPGGGTIDWNRYKVN